MLSLVEQQKAIETLMVAEAQARQNKDNTSSEKRSEYGDSKAGRFYVRAIANQLVPSITSFIHPDKKVGRGHSGAKLLRDTGIEPTIIAYLTGKAIINLMALHKAKSVKRVTLSRAIADLIHDEWRMRVFADDKKRKQLLKKLFKDFDKRTYPREWRKRTVKNYFDAEQLSWEGWTPRQKTMIGHLLLVIFRDNTAFLEEDSDGSHLRPSADFLENAKRLFIRQASSFVLYRPMVVPPYDWNEKNLFRGGYISNKIKPYAIVKGSTKRDVIRFGAMDWSKILPAVNALQQTPWKINTIMVEAIDWAYNHYMHTHSHVRAIGKLVTPNDMEFPPMPHDYETNEEVRKRHNRACFLVRDRNRQDRSKRIAVLMALSMARQFSDYEKVYFPHNLDSRGRAYPLPAILNPQGPDFVKATLEFSEGQPVEDEAQANWVAIAGANAYGNDKVSLSDRVAWVNENEDMILSIANDYTTDLRWMQAGEPFQFLRFCMEWKEFKTHGYGYHSHMVIPVDATCSGLQHYAAMLRDEVGGKSVNLIPGLPRQDVYGDVGNVVIRELHKNRNSVELLSNDESPNVLYEGDAAQDWLKFGIDRKMTKRQVMVVPYAGKFKSCMDYTKEAVAEKLEGGVLCPWDTSEDDDHHSRQMYLAKHIWNGIDEVVVKGKQAMQWLSKVASEYAKFANKVKTDDPYSRRMTWLTPDGFEVCHYREDETRKRLDTFFDGRINLVLYEGTGYLSSKDMSLAVAPNFVHALDATHMRITITKALDRGITSFGMVHDSFGVHAHKMPVFLGECIKPAFVEMYEEHDVLQEFHDRFSLIGELPPLPERGTLDLTGVLSAEFVFS